MRTYRCFFLNQAGHIQKAEIVAADADEDALVAAMKLLERESRYSTVEVWEGARKVFPQSMDRGADIEQLKRMLLAAGLIITEDTISLH